MSRIGEVIEGKYEILKEVGRGGMSVVYLAMDNRLNKQWAVKEIKRKGTNSENQIVVQSLLSEANLMKRLDHPNLPRIVDIIENGLSSQKKTTLTLYYANEKGDALVKKIQNVVYESSYSIEKDVINRLIQGPFEDEYFRTLPANLQVISISVKDKICYVNFDSSFLTDALSIDGNLIVYSIVNSLTELPDIQRVQIMVDGDSNIVFRDISLSNPLERNLNY